MKKKGNFIRSKSQKKKKNAKKSPKPKKINKIIRIKIKKY